MSGFLFREMPSTTGLWLCHETKSPLPSYSSQHQIRAGLREKINLEIDIRRSNRKLLKQKLSLILVLLVFATQGFASANPSTDKAKVLVLKAAEAQGGESKLRAIKSVQI